MLQDHSVDIHDLFAEFFNTGLGCAAASLNELLRNEVTLKLSAMHIFYEYETFREFMAEKSFSKAIVVSQTFCGAVEGTGVLMFPVTGGKTMISPLIVGNDPMVLDTFSVVELDAIAEVGNLIINAVQSSIRDMTGLAASCSLPQILYQDCRTVMEREFKNNTCFILCEMVFSVANIPTEEMAYLVYNYLNIQIIINKIQGLGMNRL
jgi:chemotaxis protein CheY-P-specific phosphatase CheC